jgi:glucose/arabinose dehydrogenase
MEPSKGKIKPSRALSILVITLTLAACGGGGSSPASSTPITPVTPVTPATSITLTKVAGGFNHPVAIANAADGSGRLFIAEQGGLVKILHNGLVSPTPFLNITSQVTPAGGEQGFLGIAFPPGFAARNSFYVNYTNRIGIGNTVVARFGLTSDPDRADSAARTQLLTITQPFANHNGGQLAFGPDGLLYIGSGDGGSSGDPLGNAQNLSVLLGKVLRIDVLSGSAPYAIPAGNPFANEIWAYGLRNPWRFSFDRTTGDLYLADVGQDLVEEINFQPAGSGAGSNYGWNVREGDRCFADPACSSAGFTPPVAVYLHGSGDCSVTGGYVYRGSTASLRGTYLYGDFCSGRIWGLQQNGTTWASRLLNDTAFSISTFGEDETGELYVADYATGDLYRIGAP